MALTHAPPVGFPTTHVELAGGAINQNGYSWSQLFSEDGAITWNRPQCADKATCQLDCRNNPQFATNCWLNVSSRPDPFGDCSASNPNWGACYWLPDSPAFAGG